MLLETPSATASTSHGSIGNAIIRVTLIMIMMIIMNGLVGPCSALCDEEHSIKWVTFLDHVTTFIVDHWLEIVTYLFQYLVVHVTEHRNRRV